MYLPIFPDTDDLILTFLVREFVDSINLWCVFQCCCGIFRGLPQPGKGPAVPARTDLVLQVLSAVWPLDRTVTSQPELSQYLQRECCWKTVRLFNFNFKCYFILGF